jgi:hypothetical protein
MGYYYERQGWRRNHYHIGSCYFLDGFYPEEISIQQACFAYPGAIRSILPLLWLDRERKVISEFAILPSFWIYGH